MTAPDWLIGLLAEHTPTLIGTRYMCRCEGVGLIDFGEHRAHVAAVIWAEIERRIGEAFVDLDDFYEDDLIAALGADA